MIRAFVTGATGFLGRHLVDVLREADVEVRAYVRLSSDTQRLKGQGVTVVSAPGDDPDALAEILADSDVVFHVAGYLTANAPFGTDANHSASEWQRYLQNNVALTEALLEASRSAAVQRFVYVSSSSVYGMDVPVPTPEEATLAPISMYGRSKLMAEEAVRGYMASGRAATIVRPPVAYGPGDRYFTPLALRLARMPILPLIQGGRTLLDLVYVRDVVELLRVAADAPAAAGRVYNGGSGRPTTLRDLVEAYRSITGRGPRILDIHPGIGRRTARFSRRLVAPLIGEAAGALTPEGLALMARDFYLDMGRAAAELDFRPAYTLTTGLRETLRHREG